MRNSKKLIVLLVTTFPLATALPVMATEVAAQQAESKPKPVSASVDNNGDGAFASDLKGAEDLLNGLSHERKMTQQQRGAFMAREMEKARKFYDFAKTTLIPHSMALVSKMKDPDKLVEEGKTMLEKDPNSWQGYDFVASGSMLKRDVDGAKANYEKALAAAPDMQKDWYRYMLAACYGAQKDADKAVELYEGIIARNDNWIAVKNSYMAASVTLVGKDDKKAVAYFDKGFQLYTPGEQGLLMKSGICDKFRGLEKGPEVCSQTN